MEMQDQDSGSARTRSADDESECGEPANKRSRPSSAEDDSISRSASVSYKRIISGKFFSVFNSLMSTFISDRKLPAHCNTEDEDECSSGEEGEKKEDGESSCIQRVTGGLVPPAPESSSFSNKEDEVQFLGAVPKARVPIGSYQRAELSKDSSTLLPESPLGKTNADISSSFRFKPALTSTNALSRSASGGTSKFYNKLEVSSPVGGISHSILGSKTKSIPKKPGGVTKNLHDKYFGFSSRKSSPSSASVKRRISSAALESFRLEDKLQYKLLLQQCTTTSTLPPLYSVYKRQSVSSSPNNSRSTTPISAITVSRLDEAIGEEKKKEYEQSLARRPIHASPRDATAAKAIEVIDLIRSESESSTTVGLKDSDSDSVIITGEVRKTDKRKNSLERKFLSSPAYHHDWMKSLRERYDTKERNAAVEAAAMEETKKRLEARRKNEIEKELEERITRNLTLLDLTYPTKVQDIQPEEEVPELPPLTPEMENVIDHALQRTGLGEVMVEKFSISITRKDLHTLSGLNWLNDEVINFYMNLLMERGKQDNCLSVYAFNTFFYPKLVSQGYSSLRRWTRKVDIFAHDLLLVPVHLGMHWCLATIDLRKKVINYYDSMLGDNDKCLHALLKYLQSEHEDKKKQPYDTSDWDIINVKDIPQQMNGSDCGMFTCKFAEYLSRNVNITFTQEDMPYFRRRMVYEIVTQTLL